MSECATVLPGQSCHVPREHREQSEILFNRNPKFRAIPDFVFKIRNVKEIGGLNNIDMNTNYYKIYMHTDTDERWWMIVCPGVSCGFVIVISSFFCIFFWGTLPLSLSRAAHCGRMPTGQSWSCGFKMETSRTSSTWPQKTWKISKSDGKMRHWRHWVDTRTSGLCPILSRSWSLSSSSWLL